MTCLQVAPPAAGGGEPDDRVAEVVDLIEAAAGADLVVLPELWPSGYFAFDRYRSVAQALDGPLLGELAAAARRLGTTVHAGSVVEAGPGGALHNTSVVFGPDGDRLAVYRKVHVFGYRSREQELVTGGSEVATFPLGGARAGLRAGMATCYDLRFPELFREVAGTVALYVVPAAWPAARAGHWSTLLRARAIENQAVVVGANAAGIDHGVALAGRSTVVDSWGEVVAEAGEEPGRLDATVDLDAVAAARAEFPALADRRWPRPVGGP
ncbi:MAG: nitrilase-related carbon-nitrogen hydrolase [Acidimicrobiales bacterium]